MSGSRFWARGQAQQQESEKADGGLVFAGALTTLDRCDRCGAQAYVRVPFPNRLELLFCAHHNRQHASALAEVAVEIHDETERLARAARSVPIRRLMGLRPRARCRIFDQNGRWRVPSARRSVHTGAA